MVCTAKLFNLLNPVSIISYGFFIYSIMNIVNGVTYVSNDSDSWYKPVYRSENPNRFAITVSLNIFFALILFDTVNQTLGIIKFLNPVLKMFG